MGILDDIGGVAGDVLGGIGAIAKPVAPLLGFAGVPTGPTGSTGGLSLDNLFSGLRQGVGMASLANPLGLVDMAKHAFDGQLTPLEKGLGIGGLLLGAGALGRHEYRKWSGAHEALGQIPDTLYMAEPVGFAQNEAALQSVGLPPRTRRPEFNPVDHGLNRYVPGISQRSARILASRDALESATALGRWDRTDPRGPVHQATLATIVDSLARRIAPEGVEGGLDPQGLRGAQLDLAKASAALDSHVFSGQSKRTEQFRKTLSKALKDPASLKPAEIEALTTDLATWGSATQRIGDPDLQFDPLAKLVGANFTDDGQMVFQVFRPPWHGAEVFSQERSGVSGKSGALISKGTLARHQRLRQLNYRPFFDGGVEHIDHLVEMGLSGDYQLELGKDWYTIGRDETHRQHAENLLPRLEKKYGPQGWKPTQDQALAAVSLTSAAENWRTNIGKAMDVLETVGRDEIGTDSFQNWLRTGHGDTIRNTQLFNELHSELNNAGGKFDTYTLKKILRFRSESPETIFQTTGGARTGMKQKNFYLNLKDPSLATPVTIDRHAFDAFLGLDTGINNRPIDSMVDANENVYQMIAEAYRAVGERRGMLPNEVQAVSWEMWKQLKEAHGKNGWARQDPFRLKLKGENPAFLALQGQGGISTQELISLAGTGRVPVLFGSRRTNGALELRTTPDGSVAVLGDPSGATHDAVRHLYPTVTDPEHGVVRWIPGVVRRVRDLKPVLDDFNSALPSGDSPGHVAESYDNTSLVTHPTIVPGHHAIVTIPEGLEAGIRAAAPAGANVRELPGSTIDKPTYSRAKLALGDLDPQTIDDSRYSQLTTSPWVGIAAPPERMAELARDMRRKGYQPIPTEGNYMGEAEASFITIGMSPEEGLKLGKKYGQESIVTPDGLHFIDGRTMPSTGGITFDQNATENFSQITMPDGKKVKFSVDIPGHFEDIPGHTLFDARGPKPVRRFHVELPAKATTEDLAMLARNLKAAGGTDVVAYGHTNNLGDDFTPTRDHVYTDGNRTVVHRSLDKDISSPHGFRSFVPNEDAVGLPSGKHSLNSRSLRERNLSHDELSGLSFVNNEVAVASDHLPGVNLKTDVFSTSYKGVKTKHFTISTVPGEMAVVTLGRTAEEAVGNMGMGGIAGHVGRRGDIVLEMPAGTSDMAPVYEAADAIRRMGYDPAKIHVEIPGGTGDVIHRMQPTLDKTPLQETVFNASGDPYTVDRDPTWKEKRWPGTPSVSPSVEQRARSVFDQAMAEMKQARILDTDYAQKLGVRNMDLSLMNVEHATMIRDTIFGLDGRFPGMLQSYNPNWIRAVDAGQMSAGRTTLAEMNFTGTGAKGTPQIQFSNDWFGLTPAQFDARVAERVAPGHWVPTELTKQSQTVAHEFMHVMHAVMHHTNKPAGLEFQSWMMRRFEFDTNGRAGNAELATGVSHYAATNWLEATAEALLEYHFSLIPRPVSVEIARNFELKFAKAGLEKHFEPGGYGPQPQFKPVETMTDEQFAATLRSNTRMLDQQKASMARRALPPPQPGTLVG